MRCKDAEVGFPRESRIPHSVQYGGWDEVVVEKVVEGVSGESESS